jgi:hypothetical protein
VKLVHLVGFVLKEINFETFSLFRRFDCHNPSGRTMVQGLTQPVTEMVTRNISLGYRWPLLGLKTLGT